MRIAHISDFHCCHWPPQLCSVFDKRLLGSLNYLLKRRHQLDYRYLKRAIQRIRMLGPDVVVISGDITCTGTPPEFQVALTELQDILLAGLPFAMIYVPGNHDAYVRNSACRQSLEQAFQRLNNKRWTLADLPARLQVGEIEFIVANECRPTCCLSSAGRLTADAAATLRQWLQQPRRQRGKRIRIGHFPLLDQRGHALGYRRRLYNAGVLAEALTTGSIDVSLCGHIHDPYIRHETNGSLEICAGALTMFGKINVLDYSPARQRFSQFWEDVADDGPAPVLRGKGFVPGGVLDS